MDSQAYILGKRLLLFTKSGYLKLMTLSMLSYVWEMQESGVIDILHETCI